MVQMNKECLQQLRSVQQMSLNRFCNVFLNNTKSNANMFIFPKPTRTSSQTKHFLRTRCCGRQSDFTVELAGSLQELQRGIFNVPQRNFKHVQRKPSLNQILTSNVRHTVRILRRQSGFMEVIVPKTLAKFRKEKTNLQNTFRLNSKQSTVLVYMNSTFRESVNKQFVNKETQRNNFFLSQVAQISKTLAVHTMAGNTCKVGKNT